MGNACSGSSRQDLPDLVQHLTGERRTDDDASPMTDSRNPTPFDTSALIPRILARDPQALELFYRREHPVVYRLCFGFLVDPGVAEDMAHDALHRIIDNLSTFDRSRAYSAWRNTLVLNLCRDRKRSDDARSRAENRAALPTYAADPHRHADPAAYAADAEIRALLMEALSVLSSREREVFVLRDLEGVDSAEAANMLGITEGTVRSLLCLARRRLRDALGDRLAVADDTTPSSRQERAR